MDKDMDTDPRLILLAPDDNVFVVREAVGAGEDIQVSGRKVRASAEIGLGHKLARRPIAKGEKVVKYGFPIGSASRDIEPGDHVHIDNLASDYTPTYSLEAAREAHREAHGRGSR